MTPPNIFIMFLWLVGGLIALCLLPVAIALLVEALPLIIAIVVGLWIYHQVL